MLSPRLTNCPECANIPSLLKKIDCKLAELGNNLYNNISYMLNKQIPTDDIIQLIGYRRILQYKYINPNYAHRYTINMIASRVIRLTVGCVSKCNTPEPCKEIPCDITIVPNPTTTTTTIAPTTTTTTTTTTIINFDITGNWNLTTPPVVDALSFKTFLESGYDGDGNQNIFSDVVITDFSLIGGRLTCNLFALENSSNFNLASLEITDVSLFGDIIGLSNISLYTNNISNANDTTWPNSMTQLDLSDNQIINFNPSTLLPNSLNTLLLINNQIVNFNPTFQLPNSLSSLYLSGNQIVTFNPSVPLPSSLNNLLLSNNLIVNFNPSIPLPSLTQIVLSYNVISTFNPSISLPLSLQGLVLTGNQIITFNPTIALPNSLNYLGLGQNPMTTAGYTASESWANAMTNIPGRGNIVFSGNTNSATGTNLETILISKGWNVIT